MKPAPYNPLATPSKATTSLRIWLDADIATWLKSGGRGYQKRMNAILRGAMLADAKGGAA